MIRTDRDANMNDHIKNATQVIGPTTSRDGQRTLLAVSQPGGSIRVQVRDAFGTYTRDFTTAWQALTYWDDQMGNNQTGDTHD